MGNFEQKVISIEVGQLRSYDCLGPVPFYITSNEGDRETYKEKKPLGSTPCCQIRRLAH